MSSSHPIPFQIFPRALWRVSSKLLRGLEYLHYRVPRVMLPDTISCLVKLECLVIYNGQGTFPETPGSALIAQGAEARVPPTMEGDDHPRVHLPSDSRCTPCSL